jgi:acylphosphatase
MTNDVKRIYATITDHVQMVGYREIVEAHGRARGLMGFVFNDVDGSVKIMASGPESAIAEFIKDINLVRSAIPSPLYPINTTYFRYLRKYLLN